MDEKRLAEIEAREKAASPRPWEWVKDPFNGGYSGIVGKDGMEVLFPNHRNDGDDGDAWFEDFPTEADREFIAHARDDIPYLTAKVRRLQAEAEARECRVNELLDQIGFPSCPFHDKGCISWAECMVKELQEERDQAVEALRAITTPMKEAGK